MKIFKAADWTISAVLLFFFAVICFRDPGTKIFLAYFVIGGWQLISLGVHRVFPQLYIRSNARKAYEVSVLIVLGALVLCLLPMLLNNAVLLMVYLYVMLVMAPVMAVTYTIIGYAEYRKMLHREFIHLKN